MPAAEESSGVPPFEAALAVVEQAEQAATGQEGAGTFELHDPVARRTDALDGLDLSRLAHPRARRRPDRRPDAIRDLRSASSVIVLGKYNRATQLKARAYLADPQGPLTLKVWRGSGDELALGHRERKVRARVRAIPEYRAPAVLASGAIAGTDFLLERVVYGRHPRTPPERLAAAKDLVGALSKAYLAHGIEERRLTEVAHPSLPDRLRRALSDPHLPWSPDWGSRRRLARRAARLLHQDRLLACSLGHGDLVATNIIRDDRGRHVLIDWEHGRDMPIGFDLSKLLFTAGDPAAVEHWTSEALAPFTGRGRRRYRWSHQLALGIGERLSFLAERRERARNAGRSEHFEAEIAAQVACFAALVRT